MLEWIETTHNANIQSQMGVELARLHQNTHDYFGFEFRQSYWANAAI